MARSRRALEAAGERVDDTLDGGPIVVVGGRIREGDVSVGHQRRRPGWAPRRSDAGSPRTRARALWRARVAISTQAAVSVGASISAIAPGLADKPRRRWYARDVWAWRHSWCELESTCVPAAV